MSDCEVSAMDEYMSQPEQNEIDLLETKVAQLTAKLDKVKNAMQKQIDCEDEYPLIFIRDALDELE